MNQFSQKVSEILAFSREEAVRLASRSVGPEHLLLGILRDKNGPIIEMFNHSNVNLQSVKEGLENKVREEEVAVLVVLVGGNGELIGLRTTTGAHRLSLTILLRHECRSSKFTKL